MLIQPLLSICNMVISSCIHEENSWKKIEKQTTQMNKSVEK